MSNIKAGDTVRFAARFLRSTAQFAGDVPHMIGPAVEVVPVVSGVTLVTFDTQYGPMKALNRNLEVVLPGVCSPA
jgi:hypothetical protein